MKKIILTNICILFGAAMQAQVPVTPDRPNPVQDSVYVGDPLKVNEMEEVIVIGYGARKAGSVTGSVVQVKAADIVRTPAQSAIQAIQGKAAGVNIITNDEPGAKPVIRIRGLGTITGGREPLYVIDGIEASSLNGISANDIATIDVLKDASSLAIYGQKGSNGVVIITTKKGRKGEIKVTYDGYYGQKTIQRDVRMADSYRFAYYNNSAIGLSDYFSFEQPYNTNWLDEITSTGEVSNHSIALSGGGENSTFYFGASNYKEKGILNGTQFERTNVISKSEYRIFGGRLKISPFINLSISNNTPKPLSAFTNAYKQSPIVPVQYPNGRWGAPLVNEAGLADLTGDRFNTVANPAAQLFFHNERNKFVTLSGAVSAEVEIIESLKFNSNFGAVADWGKGFTFTPVRDLWLAQNPSSSIEDYIAQFPVNPVINSLQQRRETSYRWNWDNFLTYKQSFDRHNVTVTAGLSRSTINISEYLRGTRQDVPEQSNYWDLNFSTFSGNGQTNVNLVVENASTTPIVSVAYFARAEYDYQNKYLISASVRREGISSFQEDKRWDLFPSVSAGWIISNESFLENSTFFNYLKLRAGYGEVGNGYGGNALNELTFNAGYNYVYGANQNIYPGNSIPFAVDPNLTWEVMKEYDFGLDFTLLKNRLSGSFDYYDRKTDNAILPIAVPTVLSPGPVYLNSGLVTNKGIEVSLKWQDKIGSVGYTIGGNYSHNKNELEKVYNTFFGNLIGGDLGNGEWTKQVLEGYPLGSFYVYDIEGYDSGGAFIYSEERIVAGSYLPTYTYGINLGLTYKNVDFSVDAYGVGGNKVYNGKKAQRQGGENVEWDILDDFWTPSTPNAENPRPFDGRPIPSTYYVEDGAYLRINNITLGYTIPKMLKGLDNVRIYVTAVNPFIFTEYTGFSPEIAGNDNGSPLGRAGIELDAYPTNKTFLFGANIGF